MRTVEQSTALIDEIVGRCVREADFAARVLENYEEALAEYRLNRAELDDFKALREQYASQAAAHWALLRKMHAG
jgi:hypothetical protein